MSDEFNEDIDGGDFSDETASDVADSSDAEEPNVEDTDTGDTEAGGGEEITEGNPNDVSDPSGTEDPNIEGTDTGGAEAGGGEEIIEENPNENSDESSDEETRNIDESQLSPSELAEKGREEMDRAQRDAEQWADENGMDRWSDGSLRGNSDEETHNIDESQLSPSELAAKGREEMYRAQRDAEQWADENGMDRWRDRSLRENSEESIEDNSGVRNYDCYGHGGDDMTTYDPYASYPESHFSETDDQYMDEQAEDTERTNARARRELNYFQRMLDEDAELEEEEEMQRQAELEEEREAEAQRQAEIEAEQEAEARRQAEMEAEQNAEARRQEEMEQAQKEAEEEARRQAEMNAEQNAEAQRQAEMEAKQRADLEADVKAQSEILNKKYIDLMDRKQAAFDCAVNSLNVEDRDRFADMQYKIGEEMEQLRVKIIENNDRLKRR